MANFHHSAQDDPVARYDPPWTATTTSTDDDDDGRPATSAGRNQWTFQSRPTTSHQPTNLHGGVAEEDEYEEEYEESDDEDVFAYLPPNTAQQQQLAQQQQQLEHQQQRQQQYSSSQYQPFAYNPESLSVPNTSTNTYPSATSLSTPYSPPSPITPSSAIPYQPQYAQYPTTPSAALTPPGTTSTTPPFAYDISHPPHHESYAMTPLTSTAPTASSPVPFNLTPSRNSREVHVALPADSSYSATAASSVDPRSLQHVTEDGAMRYRKDSKRTRGSTSSAGSADLLPPDTGSTKTDISISAGAPPYTPDSLPSTARPSTFPNHSHGIQGPNYYVDEEQDDSPYPEVRASVSNIDDPEMPTLTFRMWFLGLLLCALASGMNTFFNFRYPAPYVAPLVLLLIAYPFGKMLAYTLPIRTWTIPSKIPLIGDYEFSFNPGPFNIKEHVLIYIMANVSINPPYAMNVIVVSEKYYGYKLGLGFTFTLILATQLTGFGLAGMCRRFLVWPASLIWPLNLVACTLLNTLHAEDEGIGSGRGLTRYKFFMIALVGSFLWYFLPGFLFQALSAFSFICWIRPNNVVVNQLFGVSSGLGMSILTFDWAQISYIGSPLMVPWWAQVHIFLGFVLFYWILCPILYYSDVWHLAHLPISSNGPFDRFGKDYNVTQVIDPGTMRLNETAYNEYSPLYLPATYAITYLLAFMLSAAVLVHTALYHGRALINGIKRIKTEDDDIHARLMRNYPEVPDWWYFLFFCVFLALAIVAVQINDVEMPVWALFFAVAIPTIYIIPSAYIYAITGQPVSINLLAEIIPGVVLPGRPLANMIFKSYSVQTLQAALAFVQDLKLGHYIKVPPRATFAAQAIASLVSAIVQIGVKEWLFANVPDLCTPDQPHKLVCPNNEVYFSASAVWGLIGPVRQFGKGAVYHGQLYAIIVGGFLPLPFWLWQRRYPKSKLKYINIPVMLNGPTFIPPATGINYSSWFVVGLIFQYFIRRRNFRWWSKFNYILSAALDSGTLLSIIFIFLTLQFPKGGSIKVRWWGNLVFRQTADWQGTPYLETGPDGF